MTTIVLREATAVAVTDAYPDLLPADYVKRAKGRGHQRVYEVSDVNAVAVKMKALSLSTEDAAVRSNVKVDLSKLGVKPVIAPVAAATDTPAPEAVEPERELIRVNYGRTHKFTCAKCHKGWDDRSVIHCEDCHVSYGDPMTFKAHALGEHNQFRPCLHPAEVRDLAAAGGGTPIVDNGNDVWVAA